MITEGKWLVSSSTIVCDETARIIANCCPVGVPGLDIDMEDSIDNARLIAAAPDLLEALKGLTEDDLFSTKYMDMAREAIAKAEGK